MVIEHFLPDLLELLRALPDPRQAGMLYYPLDLLLTQALFIPLTHAASRRQFGAHCLTGNYRANISEMLGREIPELASHGTVNYLLADLDPASFEAVLPELARHLIRMRALDRFRFEGSFLVAFDGTELARWLNHEHCAQCLVANHKDGRVDYFHQVLDAKLVTGNGMTMSLGFESIENSEGVYVKQDCELKAFMRLAPTIKARFPRMRVCALGDALYACDGALDLLFELEWSFFLSFLPGRIPTLYAEAEAKLAANPRNTLVVRDDKAGGTYTYRWVENLAYRGKILHAVFLDIAMDDGKNLRLAYLTDYRPDKHNVRELVDQGGRQRSKIENCFNTQKNHGYGLEHVFGSQGHALKNYYTIIQIGHLIHQLMLHTDLLGKLPGNMDEAPLSARCALLAYRTIRVFVGTLAESLRHKTISCVENLRRIAASVQLRFVIGDTS